LGTTFFVVSEALDVDLADGFGVALEDAITLAFAVAFGEGFEVAAKAGCA
jgi:hypothetical protein